MSEELVPPLLSTPDPAPDEGLPRSAAQEHFSVAFTRLVVYEAGCSIKNHETDFDGVDITIASSQEYETWYAPQFELQLKCTTQQHLLSPSHISWRMEANAYKKLTSPKRHIPAYLGVLLLPEEEPWISIDEDGLITRSRLYWEKASELPTLTGDSKSKTVHLPRSNLFDRERLLEIMRTIGEQEESW